MLQRSKTNTSFSCCQSSSVIIKHAAACPFPSHLGSRQFLPPNRWQRVASRVRADDCWCVYFAAEADFFVFVIPSNILFEFMFWSDWRSVHVYCAKLVDFHFFFVNTSINRFLWAAKSFNLILTCSQPSSSPLILALFISLSLCALCLLLKCSRSNWVINTGDLGCCCLWPWETGSGAEEGRRRSKKRP